MVKMDRSPGLALLLLALLLLPSLASSIYCVARLSKGTVEGPFLSVADARRELNKQPGGPPNRQMICEKIPGNNGHHSMREDPQAITFGGQQQSSWREGGFEAWWYGTKDIIRMNMMCEAACNWDVRNWRCAGKTEHRANYKGHLLTSIIASSPSECCSACGFHATCNTWVYCGAENGCQGGAFKKNHCDLKKQYGKNYLKYPAKWSSGDFVPWVSGVLPEGSITSDPEQSTAGPAKWYCVARSNQNTVDGPYHTASQAMEMLLRRQAETPASKHMICEMSSCGPNRNPAALNLLALSYMQPFFAPFSHTNWWTYDMETVDEMNDLCEAKCSSPPAEETHGWFCVANMTGVKGPYKTLWPARKEHGKQLQSVPATLCAMSPGLGADPNPPIGLGMPNTWTGGGTWADWSDMAQMRTLCDLDPFCAGTPPVIWWCVANINLDFVKGPFLRLEEAKAELNQLVGGPTNRQMLCIMSNDGTAKSDPRKVESMGNQGLSQDKGNTDGFSAWWYGWNDIKKMNAKCEHRCGPDHFYYADSP